MLDVARETYKENVGDIFELNRNLSEKHNLPLVLVHQGGNFIFALKKNDVSGDLPDGFLNAVFKKGKWMFSSMELVRFFTPLSARLTIPVEKIECQDEGRIR